MAINSQKFLPGSSSSSIVRASTSSLKLDDVKTAGPNNSGDITLKIYKKVVKIDKFLKNNLKLSSKENEVNRKETEKKSREKKEKQLESPKKFKGFEILSGALPKTGILDSVKRFIIFTFAGWLFTKLFKFLPKLLDIVKFIAPIYSWVEKGIGMLLGGFITFIDLGYKAYDKVRSFTKQIGGENFQKVFDSFSSNLNKFLNLAIIAAMIAARSGVGFGGGLGGRGGLPGSVGIGGKGAGKGRVVDPKTARRFTERFGREAAERKFGKDAVKSLGGKYGRSGVTNLARKGLVASLGTGGTKVLLRSAKPILRNIPLIGGLVEFALSWALGDPVGKAAFRGIGSVLVGLVGAAIGGPIGAGVGGFVGGEIGGVLYDMIFGGKKVTKKIQKKNKGGLVKKTKGQPSRSSTIKTSGTKRIKKLPRAKLRPGKDVGGKKKIEKLYPDPESFSFGSGFNWLSSLFGGDKEELKKNKYKLPNALKTLVKVGENLGKSEDWVGALMSAGVQIALGQIPDIKGIASSITSALASARSSASQGMDIVRKSISGFADGGLVSMNSYSGNDSSVFERALEGTIKKRVDDSLRGVKKELGKSGPSRRGIGREEMLQDNRTRGAGGPDGGEGAPGDYGGDVTSVSTNLSPTQKKALAILAKYESGGNYNAVNQGGSSDGRKVLGYSGDITSAPWNKDKRPLTDMTIGEIKKRQYDDGKMSWEEWSSSGKLHAVGRYQFIGNTLPGVAKRAGIPDSAKFTPEVQDLLALQLMKERGIQPWVGPSDKATAQERQIIEQARREPINFKAEKLPATVRPSGAAIKPGDVAKGQQVAGSTGGAYAQISSGFGDRDGQDTGADIELFGPKGKIGKQFGNNSEQGPYGNRGVEISFPFELVYYDKVPGGRNAGQPAITSQGSTNRVVKGQGPGGFGHIGSYVYIDPNDGKRYEVMMGHGNQPFKKFKNGEKIAAGTVVGWQGASGSSDDGAGGLYDHVSLHVNAIDSGGNPDAVLRRVAQTLISGEGAKLTAKLREDEKNKSPIAERPKGTEAILNGRPVVWDGKTWISSTSPEAKELIKNKEEEIKKQKEQQNAAKIQSQRPWWDKLGVFGGAAAEKQRQTKTPTPSTPPTVGGGMGGRRGSGSSPSTMQGGGSINPSKPKVPNVASRALYETPGGGSMMVILPIEKIQKVPVPVGGGTVLDSFPLAGLNNSNSSYDLMRG